VSPARIGDRLGPDSAGRRAMARAAPGAWCSPVAGHVRRDVVGAGRRRRRLPRISTVIVWDLPGPAASEAPPPDFCGRRAISRCCAGLGGDPGRRPLCSAYGRMTRSAGRSASDLLLEHPGRVRAATLLCTVPGRDRNYITLGVVREWPRWSRAGIEACRTRSRQAVVRVPLVPRRRGIRPRGPGV